MILAVILVFSVLMIGGCSVDSNGIDYDTPDSGDNKDSSDNQIDDSEDKLPPIPSFPES